MAGFGTGLGLQGTPPIHGNYFNQRQQQEEARRAKRLEKDDEAYKSALKETMIKPETVHWKLQPIAKDIVANYAAQITKLRQEHPLTWENEIPQLKMDVLGQLANISSSSAKIKQIETAMDKGEIRAPESLRRYFNTNQGELDKDLPSLLEQKAYGIVIDPKTYNFGFNPVKSKDVVKEFHTAIGAKKDTYQDEIDPKTGMPKVYTYTTPTGVSEYQTRRKLLDPQIEETYTALTSGPAGSDAPHLAQNILLNYLGEKQKDPNFKEGDVLNPDGTWKQTFLEEVNDYGKGTAKSIASQYFTPNPITQPARTNININNAKEQARTVSAISEETLKAGNLRGQIPSKDNPKMMVDDIEIFDVKTPAQFTTSGFKARTAKSGSVRNLKTGKKEETPGVDNAEYAQFAVVPVYTGRNKSLGEPGALVKGDWENQQGDEFLSERLKKGEIEWKVVGIGSYTEKTVDQRKGSATYGEETEDPKSIIRDADELIGAAAVPLSEADVKDFKRNIETLKAKARTLNQGAAQPEAIKNKPADTPPPSRNAVPTAGKDKALKKISMAAAKAKNPGKSEEQIRTIYKQYGYEVE